MALLIDLACQTKRFDYFRSADLISHLSRRDWPSYGVIPAPPAR